MLYKELGINLFAQCGDNSVVKCRDTEVCLAPSCLLRSVPDLTPMLHLGCDNPSQDWHPTACFGDSKLVIDLLSIGKLSDLKEELRGALTRLEAAGEVEPEVPRPATESLEDWRSWLDGSEDTA